MRSDKDFCIIYTKDALRQAEEQGLDLVEVVSHTIPPVCRIMDYKKFLFEKEKKKANSKKKQKQFQIKEIKMRPTTGYGDYQVKLRSILRFLKNGDKVKITIRFRGREVIHQELGMNVLNTLKSDLVDNAIIENSPKRDGRQLIMIFGPRKNNFTK